MLKISGRDLLRKGGGHLQRVGKAPRQKHGKQHRHEDNQQPCQNQLYELHLNHFINMCNGPKKIILIGSRHDHPVEGFEIDHGGNLFSRLRIPGILPDVFMIKGLALWLFQGIGNNRLDGVVAVDVFLVPDVFTVTRTVLGNNVTSFVLTLAANDAHVAYFPHFHFHDRFSE